MKDISKNMQRLCAVATFQAAAGLLLCGYAWVRLGDIAETVKDAAPTHHATLMRKVVYSGHPTGEEARQFLSDHLDADMKSHDAWVASAVGWRDSMLVFGAFFAVILLCTLTAFLSVRRSNKALQGDGPRPAGSARA